MTIPGQPRSGFKRPANPPTNGAERPAAGGEIPSVSAVADLRTARRRKPVNGDHRIDRLPPHAHEAEQGVLGCALWLPVETMSACLQANKIGPEAFYDLRHQAIYAMLVDMFEKREPIDLITLQQRLKDSQVLEQVGGIPYLNALQDAVPSAANLSYYLDIVIEKATLRRLLHTCIDIAGRIYDFDGEVATLLDEAERDILKISRLAESDTEQPTIRQLVQKATAELETSYNNQGKLTGISTGLPDLDHYTDGLHGGDYTIIAAFPSVGKTSIALNIAEHIVLNEQLPVGVFSMEMSGTSLAKRFLSSNAKVNLRTISDGTITAPEFGRLIAAAGKVSQAAIHIDDTSGLSIHQLRAKARRMWQQHGIRVFVIDYLQLMNAVGGGRKIENRVQELADISGGIKALAKETNTAIITLSQLTELQGGKTRLRGAAELGQDADNVWELEALKAEDSEICVPTALHIRKQRNGPRNVTAMLNFLAPYTRFESIARAADGDPGVPM